MSQQDFAAKLGISAASLSSIFTGRTNPTNNHVMAVHRAFPQINVNWLMFGEGEMYATSPSTVETSEEHTVEPGAGVLYPSTGKEGTYPDTPAMPSMFDMEEEPSGRYPQSGGLRAAMPSTLGKERRQRDIYATENTKIIDKPQRKIKEIRVFFDDGTYESFVPSSQKG